jgi:NTE family protein
MAPNGRAAGIIIGGAVAKGAFAAGAIAYVTERLHREGTPIRAVVGTSAGALNATVVAAGVRAGDPVLAAANLRRLWEERAGALQVFWPDLSAVLRLDGLSSSKRIVELLDEACPRAARPGSPVSLRLVMAPLAGEPGPRTSFEHVERFDGADFDTDAGRRRIFEAATASAALPFVFAPVDVRGVGPCVDGGVVNNTAIKEAIDEDLEIGSVYVIVAHPPGMRIPVPEAAGLGGVSLGMRLVEMLIEERLVRDIREAQAVNAWLDALDGLERTSRIDAATRDEIIGALYPGRDARSLRKLDIVEIRPAQALEGSSFSGFFSAGTRRAYVDEGFEAARRACEGAEVGKSVHRPP